MTNPDKNIKSEVTDIFRAVLVHYDQTPVATSDNGERFAIDPSRIPHEQQVSMLWGVAKMQPVIDALRTNPRVSRLHLLQKIDMPESFEEFRSVELISRLSLSEEKIK